MGTADLLTPAQLSAVPGAGATRKHHSAGEEQPRSSTQGDATEKHCTTSEYLCNLLDHTHTHNGGGRWAQQADHAHACLVVSSKCRKNSDSLQILRAFLLDSHSLKTFDSPKHSSQQLCRTATEYQMYVILNTHTHTPHTWLLTHTHTFLSSAEATQWAASLARLLSSNHSEHDHATEQLHAHLWQTAGA